MQALIEHIIKRLTPFYPPEEVKELTYWLIEETTGMNRFEVRTCKDMINIPEIDGFIEQLCNYVPIQYIFGHTEWLGLDLQVTPATLIPRPETAELVEAIRGQGRAFSVLDVGTGSGCIALALKKKHPEWQITGIDVSTEAVNVARNNAKRNNLEVEFRQGDIFSEEFESSNSGWFDLIVSNPPYVRPSERSTLTPNTMQYEPQLALFVPEDDPLVFYRRMAELHRAPELWFEINEHLGSDMLELMQQTGYEAECLNDMYGKQRFIHATVR